MANKKNLLKDIRVLLALLFFAPILLFFVDFADLFPHRTHDMLHAQITPAILVGSTAAILFHLLIVVLFGRIYCSTICPAGVLQDIINRLDRIARIRITKKKKKSIARFSYRKPYNALRYSLFALGSALAFFGMLDIIMILDPYSNFGRVATNLFRPLFMWTNNLLAMGLTAMENYSLYQVTVHTVTSAGFWAGLTTLLIFVLMVVFRGRLFCNTLCPVGALLSLFSRFSLFRVAIDSEKCVSCKSCEKACKAEAIDAKGKTVDASRCVDCFNCLSTCHKDAIHYSFRPPLTVSKRKETAEKLTEETPSASKRQFIKTSATVMVTLPSATLLAKKTTDAEKTTNEDETAPLLPPGSLNLERFKDICTGCQICVVQCPSQVLRPSGLEYGFGYMMRPHMSYYNSYCNYDCKVCSEVCPTHAILPITQEEKHTTQVGVARFYKNLCIVSKKGTDCGACAEHCPTQAVKMVSFKGSLRIPEVTPSLCVGCGGCESICPIRPERAIKIIPLTVHKTIEKPKKEEVRDVQVDDFGF